MKCIYSMFGAACLIFALAAASDAADKTGRVAGRLNDTPMRQWANAAGEPYCRARLFDVRDDCAILLDSDRYMFGFPLYKLSADDREYARTFARTGSVQPGGSSIATKDRPHTLTNSIGMKLALIPAGEFLMGSPSTEMDEKSPPAGGSLQMWGNKMKFVRDKSGAKSQPELKRSQLADKAEHQHSVRITRPFYMGVYEVTQAEYERIMGNNPSYFCKMGEGERSVVGLDTRQFPVDFVTWYDAELFCSRLSYLEKKLYRLPIEAEWEYACRAGTPTPFGFGASMRVGDANFNGDDYVLPKGGAAPPAEAPAAGKPGTSKLHRPVPVGTYQPNAWGLYDMHGNVAEWCSDYFFSYPETVPDDPRGPADYGPDHVMRGGGCYSPAVRCRSAFRDSMNSASSERSIGFRVVLDLQTKSELPPRVEAPAELAKKAATGKDPWLITQAAAEGFTPQQRKPFFRDGKRTTEETLALSNDAGTFNPADLMPLEAAECHFRRGFDPNTLLVWTPYEVRVLGADGLTIVRKTSLSTSYLAIEERADYYVGISALTKSIDVIDKNDGHILRSLTIPKADFSSLSLHPTLPLAYVGVWFPGAPRPDANQMVPGSGPPRAPMRNSRFVIFDEKAATALASEKFVGNFVQVHPSGESLIVGLQEVVHQVWGVTKKDNIVTTNREYGSHDELMRYGLAADGMPTLKETSAGKVAVRGRCLMLSPDGRRATYMGMDSLLEFSYGEAGYDTSHLNKPPVVYAIDLQKDAHPLGEKIFGQNGRGLAYHPTLNLVALSLSGMPVFYDRETGRRLPNLMQLAPGAFEAKQTGRQNVVLHANLVFTPDGNSLLLEVHRTAHLFLQRVKLNIDSATLAKLKPRAAQGTDTATRTHADRPHAQPVRHWASADGNYTIEARFVKRDGDDVVLRRKDDGKTIHVPLARLSDKDQKYVDTLDSEK
ncbi:MAG: SUMF1/EgtB/PvdO family nonheme iron enzyme [Planctomycetes bacterium]|nr:SUMF1/EgtB/PvdO family nonheme iron enzyme [Planctomycetota bacterium]